MDDVERIRKKIRYYPNIFRDILNKTCPPVASLLFLKVIIGDKTVSESEQEPMDEEVQSIGLSETRKISDTDLTMQVWSISKKCINEIAKMCHQQNGEFIILNMLIRRILNELFILLDEDLAKTVYTINYPKDAEDLLNQAVKDFAISARLPALRSINYISALPYENNPCKGCIIFSYGDEWIRDNIIKFKHKIAFDEKNYRTIRKVLQITGQNKYAVFDINKAEIVGLVARVDSDILTKDHFILEFSGHMHWVLYYNKMKVIQYIDGIYHIADSVDLEAVCRKQFQKYYNNDFDSVDKALGFVEKVAGQIHGTMVIISSNAKGEADRLCNDNRGIKIEPVNLIKNEEWVYAVTSIDGALIVDGEFNCYSIGTILDGPSVKGDISRGARYNSALTYVQWRRDKMGENVLAIVVSEDKMVGIIY